MLNDRQIAAPSDELSAQVQMELDVKTKPPGSLGRLEAVALQMALAQGTRTPAADPAHLLLFAGDHGLVAHGVSAWPQEVTAQMVTNFLGGGAAANVFARASSVGITVVDAGIATPVPDDPRLVKFGIRAGTRDAMAEDAMTRDEAVAAVAAGAALADNIINDGARVVLIGEMGIGNTSAAALVAHTLCGTPIADLAGPGAGLDCPGVARKIDILTRVAARRPSNLAAAEALAAFGGFEIAGMVGTIIAAASRSVPILVDGFIASSAALVAVTARPEVRPYLLFAHLSDEAGHRHMVDALDAAPLLDLGLRLGEGTGSLLALPLVRSACSMLCDMATFQSAGVSGQNT